MDLFGKKEHKLHNKRGKEDCLPNKYAIPRVTIRISETTVVLHTLNRKCHTVTLSIEIVIVELFYLKFKHNLKRRMREWNLK